MESCTHCLTSQHANQNKKLYMFTKEELKQFPLDYLIKRANPLELLYAWSKIPQDYRADFDLQVRLPCFVHYNRPEWLNHTDGPPDCQAHCYLCKVALQKE